jgi:predicted ATPase
MEACIKTTHLKEKLIIRNFGPIKDVELELGRFNVLIGEQATGKSTVAKLLAVCRYFSYIIGSEIKSLPIEEPFEQGLNDWGLRDFIHTNTHISYDCNHYTFTATRTTERFTQIAEDGDAFEMEHPMFHTTLTARSESFKKLIEEFHKIRPTASTILSAVTSTHIPSSFYENDVAAVMDNPFYFPAERGLQSLFSLGNKPRISNSLFRQLADINEIAYSFKVDTLIEPLNITYKVSDGEAVVKKGTDGAFFALLNSAKGYQTTIPIVLVTKYYKEVRKKRKTFIIEEPELNLYPTAQRDLMQYLVDRVINYDNAMLLTTHSPYVLASLNNLIYSYRLGQIYPDEVENIIPKKYWLNQDEVSIYKLLGNGTSEDIFDREEGLIQAEKIDGISEDLNAKFEALLDIEFAKR